MDNINRPEGLPMPFDVRVIEVTPQMARQWLGENAEFQRRTSQAKINKYADAMKRQAWNLNGDPLRFDEKEWLIDGQHRLLACVQAGVPFTTLAIFDVDRAVMSSLDLGKPRSYKDWLDIHKIGNSGILARITELQFDIESKQFPKASEGERHQPTHDELDKTRDRHPGLAYAARVFDDRAKLRSLLGPASALWYYYCCLRHFEAANELINDLEDGGGLASDDPAFKFREILTTNRQKRNNRITARGIQARFVKTWNARTNNAKPRSINFRDYGKNPEPWPEVDPVMFTPDKSFESAVRTFLAQPNDSDKTTA